MSEEAKKVFCDFQNAGLIPQINPEDPLITQLSDLFYYFNWLNNLGYRPSQGEFDYYRAHKARLDPLESTWRSKREDHMKAQARPFLDEILPTHKTWSVRCPELSEDLFNLLSIYDAACEFYVCKDSCTWDDSQAVRAMYKIKQFIRENS